MELVDILDLKSGGQKPCGFESRPEHHQQLREEIETSSSGSLADL